MLETHWFALALFAAVLTLAWLFIEDRITTTSGLAAAMWSVLALTAGSLERILENGERVGVGSQQLGYVATALAILSLLALLLYRFDAYPPGQDDAYAQETNS